MNPNDNRNRPSSDYHGSSRPPQRSQQRPPQNRPQPSPANRPPQNGAQRSPQSRPSQNSAHRPPRRPGTDEIMRKNYAEYKRKQRQRKKVMTICAVILVILVLIVLFLLMNISCNGSDNNSQTETSAVSASTAENSNKNTSEAAIQASAKTSEEESENSEEASDKPAGKPVYTNSHQYKLNYNRFSQETQYELDNTLTTSYIALYDVTADEIIYSRDYSKKIYPASTTKLLTAITASSIIKDPKTVITVGDEINMCNWESSKAYIEEGMQLTFEMLMDALLLPSGNDAAYTIAVNAARIYKNDPKIPNEEAVKIFMDLVNDCAKQIGATHTHYVTPDGWHDDDHYTSAQDLAVIGDYARTIPIVRNSCAKPYVEWKLVKGGTMCWTNSNKLILEGSGFYSKYNDGLKTGFTDEAGTSVVASATMKGHTFIAVAMNGYTLYTKYEDCNTLFKKAFELYDLNFTTETDYEADDDNENEESSEQELQDDSEESDDDE